MFFLCVCGKNGSAQEHSKLSESGGCPDGYAGRMGETAYVQRHSKLSEYWKKKKYACFAETGKQGGFGKTAILKSGRLDGSYYENGGMSRTKARRHKGKTVLFCAFCG